MLIRLRLTTAMFLMLLGLAPHQALAGAMDVFPVRVELSAQQQVASVQVRNLGTAPMSYQADLLAWTHDLEDDRLTPTPDLLANPPLFTLAPGETQLIRIALRRPQARTVEGAYRLLVRELPPPLTRPSIALNIALDVSIPVFVAPTVPARADLVATAGDPATPGHLAVRLENRGTGHVQVRQLKLLERGGSVERGRWDQPFYLLPGQARALILPLTGAGEGASPLDLRVESTDGIFEVPLEGNPL